MATPNKDNKDNKDNNSSKKEEVKIIIPKPKNKKIYEYKVYALSNNYGGDYELIVTIRKQFKDIFEFHGRQVAEALQSAEEFVRNIGMFGITVEGPNKLFTFYPPHRIAKIEYSLTREDEDDDR